MDINDKIRELAEAGEGRTNILRAIPEATEHRIRKIIREVRGDEAGERRTLADVKPKAHKEIVINLRPIEFTLPKYKKATQSPDEFPTAIFVGDAHPPFHSKENISVACSIIAEQAKIRLDKLIDLGDGADFYSVSRWDQSPLRRNQLQDELIVAADVRAQITDAAKDAGELHYIKGNHEERLFDYICRTAPALASLPQLSVPSLLGLTSLGWEYHENYMMVTPNFIAKHGDSVAGASAATAKKELDTTWMSGISGHVHRIGVHYRTAWRHVITNEPPAVWIENGCLCSPDPEYQSGKHSNWQPGITVIRFDPEGFPLAPEIIPIYQGRAMFRGRMYTAS